MRPRRLAVVVGVVLVAAVVVTAGHRATSDRDPVPRPSSRGETDGGARSAKPGRPAGRAGAYPRTRDGARAAALAYAGAPQRWLYLNDASVEAAVRAIATPGAADRLVGEVLGEVRAAREGLAPSPGPVWWIVHPLATRVRHHGPSRALVEVWTVSVLAAPEVALPQADWATVRVHLAWVGGTWRAANVTDQAGPTPSAGGRDDPWSPPAFTEALAGFERIGEERP